MVFENPPFPRHTTERMRNSSFSQAYHCVMLHDNHQTSKSLSFALAHARARPLLVAVSHCNQTLHFIVLAAFPAEAGSFRPSQIFVLHAFHAAVGNFRLSHYRVTSRSSILLRLLHYRALQHQTHLTQQSLSAARRQSQGSPRAYYRA